MNSKGFVFLAFLLSSLIFSGGLSGPADAQTWASNCWLEVDGPGNEGNEDALRAVGEADCHSIVPECDHPCRVQLGDGGILVCENDEVPGGWIVAIPGENNDFTVLEKRVPHENYTVMVEDPDTMDYVEAGVSGPPDYQSHFDLPVGIPYTDRVRIIDPGTSMAPPPLVGADIDAICSDVVENEPCPGDQAWGPSRIVLDTAAFGGNTLSGSYSMNYLLLLLLPVGAVLTWKVLRRRSR